MNKVKKNRLKENKKKPSSTHYHCFGVNNSRSHDPLRVAQWNTQWTTLSKRSLCNDFLWKRTTFLSTAVVNCEGNQRMKPLVCNTDSMSISFSAVSLYVWGTPTNRKSEILACVKKAPQRSNLCSLKRSRSEKRVSVQCKKNKEGFGLGWGKPLWPGSLRWGLQPARGSVDRGWWHPSGETEESKNRTMCVKVTSKPFKFSPPTNDIMSESAWRWASVN